MNRLGLHKLPSVVILDWSQVSPLFFISLFVSFSLYLISLCLLALCTALSLSPLLLFLLFCYLFFLIFCFVSSFWFLSSLTFRLPFSLLFPPLTFFLPSLYFSLPSSSTCCSLSNYFPLLFYSGKALPVWPRRTPHPCHPPHPLRWFPLQQTPPLCPFCASQPSSQSSPFSRPLRRQHYAARARGCG